MTDETQTPAQNDTDAAASSQVDAGAAGDATPPEGGGAPASAEQAGEQTTSESAGGTGGDQDPPTGAPEQYEPFAIPEGVALDETVHASFQELAKSQNLSQEQAQAMVDFHMQSVQQAQADWDATTANWRNTVQTDPELGGAKYEQSLATANKAIDTFGTPELRAFLDESGLGTHPELLRAFHRVGSAISEDRMVSGDGGDATSRPFYANSNMNR